MRTKKENEKLVNEIIEKVAAGKSVRSIIMKGKGKYPSYSTFRLHINTNEELRKKYLEATETRAANEFDNILEIADEQVDYSNSSVVQHQKLRIDARKWVLSKMMPKKYGDKLDLNHGGQEGNPVIEKIERVIIKPQSNDPELNN